MKNKDDTLSASVALQVWLSLAEFELCAHDSLVEGGSEASEQEVQLAIRRAREVYRKANESLRKTNEKEQRVQLIDEWKAFEVNSTLREFYIYYLQLKEWLANIESQMKAECNCTLCDSKYQVYVLGRS